MKNEFIPLVIFMMLVLTTTCVFASTSIAATDIYVSTKGNDTTGNGTLSHPYATLLKASRVVHPGQTVHFAPGIYYGCTSPDASGTATRRIRYVSDTKWGAKLVGKADDTGRHIIYNTGDYCDFDGFEVYSENLCVIVGIHIVASHNRVMNCLVHDISHSNLNEGGGGIVCDYSPTASLVNNDIINNVVYNIDYGTTDRKFHCIYHCTTGKIYNNLVWHASGYGIHMYHDPHDMTVFNNTIFSCDGGGIVFGKGDAGEPKGLADNLSCKNNIVVGCQGDALQEVGKSHLGTNIVWANNCLYNNSRNYSFYGGRVPTNTVSADPQFIKYQSDGGGDYHLKSTSPCIDTGASSGGNGPPSNDLDYNSRPQGSGYDIGCYEFVTKPMDVQR